MRVEQLKIQFPERNSFALVDGWLNYPAADHYLVRIQLKTKMCEIIKIDDFPKIKFWSIRQVNNQIALIYSNQKAKKQFLRTLILHLDDDDDSSTEKAFMDEESEMIGDCSKSYTYLSTNLDIDCCDKSYCYDNNKYYTIPRYGLGAAAFTRDNRLYWIEENKNRFFLNSMDMDCEKKTEREELKAERMPKITDFSSKSISDLTQSICGLSRMCEIKYARQDETSIYIFQANDSKLEIYRIKVFNSAKAEQRDQLVACSTCADEELLLPIAKAFRCAECVEKDLLSNDHYLCAHCTALRHRGHNYKTLFLDETVKRSFLAQFNVGDIEGVKRKADQISSQLRNLDRTANKLRKMELEFEKKKRRIMETDILTMEELEAEKEELERLYKTLLQDKISLAEQNTKIGK